MVSTCCYIARIYGVRSAMPMFKALKACPDAVVIKPDMEKYARVGRADPRHDAGPDARRSSPSPSTRPSSTSPAPSGCTARRPAVTLARFARAVEQELGLSVSVGLSYNKFLAKIASDLDKPRGFAVIGRAEAARFLAARPIGIIPGVGKVDAGAPRPGRAAHSSATSSAAPRPSRPPLWRGGPAPRPARRAARTAAP